MAGRYDARSDQYNGPFVANDTLNLDCHCIADLLYRRRPQNHSFDTNCHCPRGCHWRRPATICAASRHEYAASIPAACQQHAECRSNGYQPHHTRRINEDRCRYELIGSLLHEPNGINVLEVVRLGTLNLYRRNSNANLSTHNTSYH